MKNITKGKTVMIGQQKTLEIQILSFFNFNPNKQGIGEKSPTFVKKNKNNFTP